MNLHHFMNKKYINLESGNRKCSYILTSGLYFFMLSPFWNEWKTLLLGKKCISFSDNETKNIRRLEHNKNFFLMFR